jgi:hypothetical protein
MVALAHIILHCAALLRPMTHHTRCSRALVLVLPLCCARLLLLIACSQRLAPIEVLTDSAKQLKLEEALEENVWSMLGCCMWITTCLPMCQPTARHMQWCVLGS